MCSFCSYVVFTCICVCCCNIWLGNGGNFSNMSKSSNVSNATTVASGAVQASGILNHTQFLLDSLVDNGLQIFAKIQAANASAFGPYVVESLEFC